MAMKCCFQIFRTNYFVVCFMLSRVMSIRVIYLFMNKKIHHKWQKQSNTVSVCLVCGLFKHTKWMNNFQSWTNESYYEMPDGNQFTLSPSCLEKFKQLTINL